MLHNALAVCMLYYTYLLTYLLTYFLIENWAKCDSDEAA